MVVFSLDLLQSPPSPPPDILILTSKWPDLNNGGQFSWDSAIKIPKNYFFSDNVWLVFVSYQN